MKAISAVLLVVLWAGGALAQRDLEPRQLVEGPTAGLLPRGSFDMDFRFYGSDGILGTLSIGVFDRGMLGISYGGRDVLGNRSVTWNPRLEFSGKIRVIDEGQSVPAIALGYSSQGYGTYEEALSRYASKSKGFYAVASRNFMSSLGQVGAHLGFNKSLEDGDGDGDLSGYIGVDKGLGKDFYLVAEYDFALNDNEDNALGSGKGFFNTGVRWAVSKQFAVMFDLKNIFRNGHRNPQPDRELRIVYFERF